jgi:hypothetical protein
VLHCQHSSTQSINCTAAPIQFYKPFLGVNFKVYDSSHSIPSSSSGSSSTASLQQAEL